MSKLKVLVPLGGTEKSVHSLNWLKKYFSNKDVEVTLINVVEVFYNADNFSLINLETAEQASRQVLDAAEKELEGYKVNKLSAAGYISDVIVAEAKNGNYDMIVMTKSSVKGISRVIGSVTNKVIHNSDVTAVVVPE
jgi:nucleotide-binding universal stress UspA family protein